MKFEIEFSNTSTEELAAVGTFVDALIRARKQDDSPVDFPFSDPPQSSTIEWKDSPPKLVETPIDVAEIEQELVVPESMVGPALSALGLSTPSESSHPDPELELDSAGNSYDPNIHSRGKTKDKSGCWRKKRGVSAAAVSLSTPPPPSAGASTPPPPPPPPPPTPTDGITTDVYNELLKKVSGLLLNGFLKQQDFDTQMAALGVSNVLVLKQNPAACQALLDYVNVLPAETVE